MDDPESILKCTNKAFLSELLSANGIATPRDDPGDRPDPWRVSRRRSPTPVVLKVPDGAFSRDVKKAENWREFERIAHQMLNAVRHHPGAGIPLYAVRLAHRRAGRRADLCREVFHVERALADHRPWRGGRPCRGGRPKPSISPRCRPRCWSRACVPPALIGNGLYGVDLKQTQTGVVVIEINDNPNIDMGMEDAAAGDALYRTILGSSAGAGRCPASHHRAGGTSGIGAAACRPAARRRLLSDETRQPRCRNTGAICQRQLDKVEPRCTARAGVPLSP